jgi:glycosyltransferase involved in cell wall biosynthesis
MRRTSKPKVTIEIGPLFEDQWTGIPVFTRRLIQSILRDGRVELDFTFNLARIPATQVQAAINLGTGTFLRQQYEQDAAGGELIDTRSHFLFPSVKNSFGISNFEASTVHDMSTLFMPENHEAANVAHHLQHIEKELASNDRVFCVSDATRCALISAFPSVASKSKVLYQYADWPEEFEMLERNLPSIKLGRYAVVVGTIEPRKNLTLLINALSLPEIARSDLRFLIIGRKGWLVDKFLADLTPEQRDRLVFSGFVSEFIKYRLIKNAVFMVFPSLYEGFGIPALEAMSLGKPVLASRTSSFPEVIGDGGIYFDPLSPTEFAAALDEIADPRKIAELAPKAVKQNNAFGWKRMAAPVVEWVSSR